MTGLKYGDSGYFSITQQIRRIICSMATPFESIGSIIWSIWIVIIFKKKVTRICELSLRWYKQRQKSVAEIFRVKYFIGKCEALHISRIMYEISLLFEAIWLKIGSWKAIGFKNEMIFRASEHLVDVRFVTLSQNKDCFKLSDSLNGVGNSFEAISPPSTVD